MKPLEILPYDLNWVSLFHKEATLIKKVLCHDCKNIHHIGSTSVPGLFSKPIIDILLLFQNRFQIIERLESIGYRYKGELNIPFRFYFSKEGDVKIHLHAYERVEDFENPEVNLNIMFRDYLKAHPKVLADYNQLKQNLLSKKPYLSRNDYTLGKDSFIRKVLKKAGFKDLRLMRCFHAYEWASYYKILGDHKIVKSYEDSFKEEDYCFVFYKGVVITAAAYLKVIDNQNIMIQFLGVNKAYAQKAYEGKMLEFLKRWGESQKKRLLVTF